MEEINSMKEKGSFNNFISDEMSNQERKTDGVSGKVLETYQGDYQEWRSRQFNSCRDLHYKTIKPIEHKIDRNDLERFVDEPHRKTAVPKKSFGIFGSITAFVGSLFNWSSKKTSLTSDNEQVKNVNSQIFTDNVLGATYSESFNAQEDQTNFGIHFKNVKKFHKEKEFSKDPSIQYLCQNQFVDRNAVIYQSCHWEMELGKEMGEKRLFEKGYCKVCFALPGNDLKEIRIPVDLRFLKLNSPDEVEIFLNLVIDQDVSKDSLTLNELKKCMREKYINLVWSQQMKKIIEGFQGDKKNLQTVLLLLFSEFKTNLERKGPLTEVLGDFFKEKLKNAGLQQYEESLGDSLKKEIEELEKGVNSFVDKCCEKNFQQVKNMLDYASSYVYEMIDKAQFSLGKDIYFEGVVSHFEIFPKILIEKKCSQDEFFEKAYNDHLNNLHEFRNFNISEYLKMDFDWDYDKIIDVDKEHEKVIDCIKKDSSWAPQEKEAIIKYLDYYYKISTSDWQEPSLKQVQTINELLQNWNAFFGESKWPDNLKMEIMQMLVDPTTCRMITDFLEYATLAQEQNQGALERGEKISIHSYHNSRLREMCSKIVDNLSERIEPLKKTELMLLLGKTLLKVYVEPPQQNVESFENIEKMVLDSENKKKSEIINEKQSSSVQNHSVEAQYKELIEKYLKKCESFLPKNLAQDEKTKILTRVREYIEIIQDLSLSSFEKIVNYIDQLESGYHQNLIQLASCLHGKTMLEKHGQFIMGFDIQSPALLTEPLIPIMELMGSSRNIQITSDSYPQSVYHPSYVRFKRLGGGMRDLNLWADGGIEDYLKMNLPQNSSEALKLHFQPREGSEHLGIKLLWHMEEGEMLSNEIEDNFNKQSRIFKKGTCELSLALPSLGDVRSCQVPLDLSPFALSDVASILEVTKAIREMMKDVNSSTERKKKLLNFIDRIKKENKYPKILENTQLFIETALEFAEKLDLAFDKILSSLGRPEVHFSDVEELGDLIPFTMLQNKLKDDEMLRNSWENYLKNIGEARKIFMEAYIQEKEVDPKKVDSDKINKFKEDLRKNVERVFSINEDYQIVIAYIEKMSRLAIEPWNSQNNYYVKMMEQAVAGFAKLQKKHANERS